jgi:glycine/D-amino acid oxidase-like deaminating enzyme
MVETADIVVVGGGCIGTSVALHLAEQKAGTIMLLEKGAIATGASGKGTGIIRTHYTHPVLAQLALASLQRFHAFKDRYGGYEAGFYPCGYAVLVDEAEAATLQQVVAMHQDIGINVSLVKPDAIAAQMPMLRLDDVAAIAYEPDSGFGSPPQTTYAFAHRAQELGVDIRIDTPATEIELDAEGRIAAVQTPTGTIATRTVIDCVGPWAKQFTERLGYPFPVRPVLEHVVVVERPSAHAAIHPVVSDLVTLSHFRSDGDRPYTRIGNSDPSEHHRLMLNSPDEFHGQVIPDIDTTLQRKLVERCPVLQDAPVTDTYTGIWALTPDYQPIIDRLEAIPGFYCAVGFSGHGYKLSPIMGDLISRKILGQEDESTALLDMFRCDRFQTNQLVKSPVTYAKASGVR